MQKVNYQNIGEHLLAVVPEFKDIFEQYIRNHHGQSLPHVLFGDFTRFVIEVFLRSESNSKANDVFLRSISFVEELLETQDPSLRELVGASFLENLYQPGENREKVIVDMKKYFKPHTLALVNEMRN